MIDDHVTRYMGADVDAYLESERGPAWELFHGFIFYGFSYFICNLFTLTVWIIVSVEHIYGFDLLARIN